MDGASFGLVLDKVARAKGERRLRITAQAGLRTMVYAWKGVAPLPSGFSVGDVLKSAKLTSTGTAVFGSSPAAGLARAKNWLAIAGTVKP